MQQKSSRSMSMAGTVVYGLFIIVLLGIVFLLLVKLAEILKTIAAPLGLESAFGAMVALIIVITVTLAVLLLFSWIVGSIIRRAVSYDKFEGAILKKIPGYQIIANVTKGFSEGKTAYPSVMRAALFLVVSMLAFSAVKANDCNRVFKGMYTWGGEVNVFQPCESSDVFWVSASSWVLRPLIEYVKKSISTPYQSIYIEFRGNILNEVRGGFAEQYDGLIRVSEVNHKSGYIPAECVKE